MAEALTFLAQEIGRAFALVWGGIGIAIKLNYEVMSVVITITSQIVQLLFLLTQKSSQVCSILASDLVLFMGDIGSGVIAILTTLQNLGKGLINAVLVLVASSVAACIHIYDIIRSFYSFIIDIIFNIFNHLGYALNLIKHGCVLFGSSVIFAVSFLPKLISLIVTSIIQFCVNTYIESCLFVHNSLLSCRQTANNFVKSVSEYFIDIPISAILGCCIGVLFLVAFKYFLQYVAANLVIWPDINLSSIASSVKSRVIQWCIWIKQINLMPAPSVEPEENNELSRPSSQNGIQRQEELPSSSSSSSSLNLERTITPIVSPSLTRKPLTRRQRTLGLANDVTDEDVAQNKSPSKYNKDIKSSTGNNLTWAKDLYKELQDERDGKLCIICQDRVKRVILLPCRHLCLCDACRSAVITRDNTCPICRKPILDSLRVFL